MTQQAHKLFSQWDQDELRRAMTMVECETGKPKEVGNDGGSREWRKYRELFIAHEFLTGEDISRMGEFCTDAVAQREARQMDKQSLQAADNAGNSGIRYRLLASYITVQGIRCHAIHWIDRGEIGGYLGDGAVLPQDGTAEAHGVAVLLRGTFREGVYTSGILPMKVFVMEDEG